MKRGEIYLVALDPVLGSETGKTRPAIVLQNVLLPAEQTGLPKESKALCEQIRTVSRQRLGAAAIGKVPDAILTQVRSALDRHLWFPD